MSYSPATRRAIAKYGLNVCMEAQALNRQGWGASSIAHSTPVGNVCRTTRAVDAAINAAEEVTRVQAGELPPVECGYMLLCHNPATTEIDCGPVGVVPACARCAAKYDRMSCRVEA